MFKALRERSRRVFTRKLFGYFVLIVILYLVFMWRLGSLTPGLSPAESAAQNNAASLHALFSHPANLPLNLLQFVFLKISPNSLGSLRIASVLMAVIFSFCFYEVAVGWFGKVVGLFGSFIFVSLPLFVISSRQATGEIMFFLPILLIWLFWLLAKSSKRAGWIWLALLVVSALSLYTPGMLWWLAGAYFVSRRRLNDIAGELSSKLSLAGLAISMLIIAPLGSSIISQTNNIKVMLALPPQLAQPLDIVKDIGWMVLALFIKTGSSNPLILGRTPLLNILVLALIIFGVYAMRKADSVKTISLGLSILLAVLLAGLNDNIAYLGLGLPGIMIFASAGLRYLYVEWRTIFPKNPLAKSFAVVLIALVALAQTYYGLRYSLVAWPNSTPVKHLYVLK